MSRRAQSMPAPGYMEKPARSRCTESICILWKILTCIISHTTLVALVVVYCIGGAYLFQYLEEDNEKEVKKNIQATRQTVVDFIWNLTATSDVLKEENWTSTVEIGLKDFELKILNAMKIEGWNGDENINKTQWTFMGSLFYSIIVITTIGYGHIAPRTEWGKVTTIFYAILGIPLMLLCLSNIGDVMASSFRFLYWRVCCFICTREPRKRRSRSTTKLRQRSSRSQPPPSLLRRSIRTSQRSADSGFATYDLALQLPHSHSDPELRYSQMEYFRNELPRERYDKYNNPDEDNFEFDDRHVRRHNSQLSERSQRSAVQRVSSRSRTRERGRDIDQERFSHQKDRYNSMEEVNMPRSKRAQSQRPMRTTSVGRDIKSSSYSQTLPSNLNKPQSNTPKSRAKSVDPRSSYCEDITDEMVRKTPILCNRYAIHELDRRESSEFMRHKPRKTSDDTHQRQRKTANIPRNHSMPPQSYNYQPQVQPSRRERDSNYQRENRHSINQRNKLELPEFEHSRKSDDRRRNHNRRDPRMASRYGECYDDQDFDEAFQMQPIRRERRPKRPAASTALPPPRIMSPMGFVVNRQAKIRSYQDDDLYYDEEGDSYGDSSTQNRPVPIWLCVFLVVGYILAGAFIFNQWEKWSFLDSAYFCFITLTTIGFGDFVPAQGLKDNSKESIALCSLYLLFGISLLAMSFNLVQEEVIANVKEVARRLGILKQEEELDD